MKIDRLLGITIYLLNHGKSSASTLAGKYEVSTRTIQRDIETLCQAGIPIIATFGADGGYEIYQDFKLEHHLVENKDYTFIVTALKGLISAYQNPNIETTYEKIMALVNQQEESNIILDFSVLKEDKTTNSKLRKIDECLLKNKAVSFNYTNSENKSGLYEVEPIAINYRWYHWYLVAYHNLKKEYKLFKLVRMNDIKELDTIITIKHDPVQDILKRMDNMDNRKYVDIKLYCNSEIRVKVLEYLNGTIIEEVENGDFIMKILVPENEHFWYASLLGLGDKVKVLEPESLKLRLCEQCRGIIELYQKL